MKKINVFGMILFTMVAMVSCNNSEKQFDEGLANGYVLMAKTMYGNALIYDEFANSWRQAIFDKKTPSGKYCDDFNEALREVIDSLDAYDIRKETKEFNDSLLLIASELNPPPSDRKDCYDDFVEIVSNVSTLTRNVIEPNGSLNDYRDRNKELFDIIAKEVDQFRIKYGKILPKKEEEK